MPALSVVIPTLGRATLHEQLDALEACTWTRPWEIVLADNSGEQAALPISIAWARRLPNLRHVDASRCPGRSHAVNYGAVRARAPYLLFVDDDDRVCVNLIQRVGDALVAGERVVVFNLEVRSLNAPHVWRSYHHAQLEEQRPMFRSVPAVWGCAGIDRELFLEVGGFDESLPYAEDLEFSLRLNATTGIVPYWIPERLLRYRLRHTFAERFRQSSLVTRTITQLAQSHPLHVSVPARNRYLGLLSDVVRCAPQFSRCLRGEERLRLAGRLGAAWGQFSAPMLASREVVEAAEGVHR